MSFRSHVHCRLPLLCILTAVGVLGALGSATAEHPCDIFSNDFVKVIVDMDPAAPGCQPSVTVPANTAVIADVAIWVFDPLEHDIWSVGYLGGINRGIAFGHTPSNAAIGTVADVVATIRAAINPDNTAWMDPAPGLDPGFAGPEVQYVECCGPAPAPIPRNPSQPIFTVDITLAGARPGDVFDFYLLDFVTVWTSGSNGAFSTQSHNSLDTGGDVIPDGTQTIYGVDPDPALPSPPAAFLVDYVDGQQNVGAATIIVVARPGDMNADGVVDLADLPGFVNVLIGATTDPVQVSLGDMNRDASTDGADIPEFAHTVASP